MSQLQFLDSPKIKVLCLGLRRKQVIEASGHVVCLFLHKLGFDISQNRAGGTNLSVCKELIFFFKFFNF